MSLKHSLTRIVALTATLLVACGDEVTEVTEVHETGMKIVEEGEKLPECTTENEGTMVYALDSAAAYACVDNEWVTFNGKDGEKGDKGDKGAPGDSGEAGTSCTMESLPDSSGFKVICGGDSVGVVLNGEKGEQGDKGEDGNDGKDGQDGKSIEGAENFFIDARDKQIYKKVTIGTKTWMAENLNYETANSLCYMDSCAKYGRYYTWADAMDSAAVFSDNAKGCGYDVECTIKTPARGICPEGWHIPDSTEWRTLYSVMGKSSNAMQAKGFDNWPDATDAYGFSALPAGGYMRSAFYDVGGYARFWSAAEFTEYDNYSADYWYLNAIGATLSFTDENFSLSVRCIKD
ncbi:MULTISPECIES: fibrobacter succinogenes major paralogous domain-containing protein [unclassified Fibrobacter]|uniref:fibrobacter succinogenes major paralogous domain-containing protein n=1 Tax=unclassified Fibrobacter TaxID=2634177 RepID=UPI0025C52D8D|nr:MULTISPECIES: FISUMP domain-containing protein [unclassified Fibrobacter]